MEWEANTQTMQRILVRSKSISAARPISHLESESTAAIHFPASPEEANLQCWPGLWAQRDCSFSMQPQQPQVLPGSAGVASCSITGTSLLQWLPFHSPDLQPAGHCFGQPHLNSSISFGFPVLAGIPPEVSETPCSQLQHMPPGM